MTSSLPDEVLEMVVIPRVTDLCATLLRQQFGDLIPVKTRIAQNHPLPSIVVRKIDTWGRAKKDQRAVAPRTEQVVIHALCDGPNAEKDAELLSEAARVALLDSINQVVPGKGHIVSVDPISLPSRSPDWATSTGPVQYASLPDGVERYEAKYEVTYRRSAA